MSMVPTSKEQTLTFGKIDYRIQGKTVSGAAHWPPRGACAPRESPDLMNVENETRQKRIGGDVRGVLELFYWLVWAVDIDALPLRVD